MSCLLTHFYSADSETSHSDGALLALSRQKAPGAPGDRLINASESSSCDARGC